MKSSARIKASVAGGALLLAGFAGGAVLAATGSASAATGAVTTGVTTAAQKIDPTESIRSDEHLLTGTTATKVRAAALAKYPGASIQRVETDSDGVYEAHIVTSSGSHVIVQVGKDFTVTGTQTGGPGGVRGATPSQGGAAPQSGTPQQG